ncbi:hypothetical protein [Rhodospirillum rubrum]|uniref:Uncharacterized protein n=1 Tax=Rhodospirillum rubrum (strain ATCC 11170 / ATH 1.1.1 / DSM 467 / LMG 4362 / NCIMB 8255 / S1) TaxID=269796 RepID=Q2RUM3_RHORT|nr:hypothetical protein [Rhodospirillum rubrum]ABC22172.1 hypothetical protein Rru_A1371 [Rhodospirillum rubrum ATCC 11170]AEO47886.1 hypothetical protein F11_07080 [Rhodospirillum rubrum F11]MBK5953761.1 hypothetical protein [Rhodospirillum rubrum]QXG81820.1 hypothetical protein KUL73_07125 [Rhodospirillum rubrum]HAQ00398.1 hypothetical protein [Rhodospirillum rubrum]
MSPGDFFQALRALGEAHAGLFGGVTPTGPALSALLACHERLPEGGLWRSFSDLTADGAPLELTEHFGAQASFGLTLDPRPYKGAEAGRFA